MGETPREEAEARETVAEPAAAPVAGREAEPEREYRGTGIYVWAIVGFLIAAAVIVFIVQNTEGVELEWTVWETDVSLAAVVLGALAAGAGLAGIAGFVWRRSRRRSLREREELRRLRAGRGD